MGKAFVILSFIEFISSSRKMVSRPTTRNFFVKSTIEPLSVKAMFCRVERTLIEFQRFTKRDESSS